MEKPYAAIKTSFHGSYRGAGRIERIFAACEVFQTNGQTNAALMTLRPRDAGLSPALRSGSACVVGATYALETKRVKRCLALHVAIIAQYAHPLVSVLGGHWCHADLVIEVAPRLTHVADGSSAQRASISAVGRV